MRKNSRKIFFRNLFIMLALVAAATALGSLLCLPERQNTTIAVVYILSVVLVARFTDGYLAGITASILSLMAYNWFFTEPVYTLKVKEPENLITFFIMTLTALITSALTTKFKKVAAEAKEKEAESNALFHLTSRLTKARDLPAVAGDTALAVSRLLSVPAVCTVFGEKREEDYTVCRPSPGETALPGTDSAALRSRMQRGVPSADESGRYFDYPILAGEEILGALRLPPELPQHLTGAQNRTLHAMLESAALAMERCRSLRKQEESRRETEQERYRGNLLRAISHDIRTPLAGVMGSAEMLMQMTEPGDPRYSLEQDIYRDADWLHALVENILNLTRIEDGRLSLKKVPEPIEEVIGSACRSMEKRLPGREITVEMPENVLMVPMDARLIHQVLVNLLDNAAAHSPQETAITIRVEERGPEIACTVLDHGTGVAPGDLTRVFEMFYTTRGRSADARRGMGLGLAICRSVIEAHGGKISAANRPDGPGAEFTFTLPREEEPA